MTFLPNGEEIVSETVDTNDDTAVTASLRMGGAKYCGLYVSNISGGSDSHVMIIQSSPDNIKWFDTAHSITGVGFVHESICITGWIRGKVLTAEGGASSSKVSLVAK